MKEDGRGKSQNSKVICTCTVDYMLNIDTNSNVMLAASQDLSPRHRMSFTRYRHCLIDVLKIVSARARALAPRVARFKSRGNLVYMDKCYGTYWL